MKFFRARSLVAELFNWLPSLIAFFFLADKARWFWTNSPYMQFGWMIPVLGGYLVWESWGENRAVQPICQWNSASVGLFIFGSFAMFMTQLYQSAYGTTPASMGGLGLGFFFVACGNVTYLYGGNGVRKFGFPFFFLLLSVPLPPMIYGKIVGSLQTLVATATVEILALTGVPARLEGSLVHLPSGIVGVNEACSGIRSLQSTLMATLFIGYLTLKYWVSRFWLVIFGIGIAVLGNLVRVFSLSWSASKYGVQSVDSAHDVAGWTILGVTVVGVGALSWVLGKVEGSLLHGKKILHRV